MSQPTHVTIPLPIFEDVIRHLATRPLGEVLNLYNALTTNARPFALPDESDPSPEPHILPVP